MWKERERGPVGPHEWAHNPLCGWQRGTAVHAGLGVEKAVQSTWIYEVEGKGGVRNKTKGRKYILEQSEKPIKIPGTSSSTK